MSGLTKVLPPVVQPQNETYEAPKAFSTALITTSFEPPPYQQRKSFIPRSENDFGDGGAFPEIAIAQYPLGMGKKDLQKSNALSIQVDAEGNIKYDAIAKYGHGKDRVVHSKFKQLVPKGVLDDDDPELQRPDEETIQKQTEKTRLALEKLTNEKVSAAMPVKRAERRGPTQHIRYTPSQQGEAFNSGAKQRVITMVEMQKDPMEPPKFRTNKKIPGGPPSPPPPIIHSPNRKISVTEQQAWRIPPCISNWKNAKGHTIPLDKRLAADGRGLQDVHINENFAQLSEALYIADRKARKNVEMRANVERSIAAREKEAKERQLRQLAEESRNKRAGFRKEDNEEVIERDKIRRERERDRARRRNIERAAPEKKNRLRNEDRDISEKIALGIPNKSRGQNDTQFDQRLFNKTAGMDSGFAGGDDEGYSVYDQPWRREGQAGNIYRPSRNKDSEVYGDEDIERLKRKNRFVPEKPFSGADDEQGRRDGPVQFEKKDSYEDVFQLDKFMELAKRAGKRGSEKEDHDKTKRKRN